jgi:cardiolipin synthase
MPVSAPGPRAQLVVNAMRKSPQPASPPRLQDRATVRPVALFLLGSQVAVLAGVAFFYWPSDPSGFLRVAAYSFAALVAIFLIVLVCVRLLGGPDATLRGGLGLANRLTLLRFVLIAPTAGLLAEDHLLGALGFYALSGLTDIVDGVTARRRGEETRFGVIMDPTADILTTTAVFGVLWAKGLVPGWVLGILLVRYLSLGAGSVILHFSTGPIEFKATPVGKIAGVLQAALAMIIISLTAGGLAWRDDVGPFLYPLLAIIFGSVIVSQGIAAVRHIEKRTAHVGSQGRSRRFSADIDYADAEPGGSDR